MSLNVGLCAACAHARTIGNRRGSRFWLCERSRVDPSFPRYPRLPVAACRGFEPAPEPRAEPDAVDGDPVPPTGESP
jgi:hypothetical protein